MSSEDSYDSDYHNNSDSDESRHPYRRRVRRRNSYDSESEHEHSDRPHRGRYAVESEEEASADEVQIHANAPPGPAMNRQAPRIPLPTAQHQAARAVQRRMQPEVVIERAAPRRIIPLPQEGRSLARLVGSNRQLSNDGADARRVEEALAGHGRDRGLGAAGPSVARRIAAHRLREQEVVDLTEDSDEDVVFVAQPAPRAAAVPPRIPRRHVAFAGHDQELPEGAPRRPEGNQIRDQLRDLEATLALRRAQNRAMLLAERERIRRAHEPVRAEPPGPIGLGGAMVQRGGQVVYLPAGGGYADQEALLDRLGAQLGAGGLQAIAGEGGRLEALLQHAPAHIQNILHRVRGLAGGFLAGGAGPRAPPPPDVPATIAAIEKEKPTFPTPLPGFTDNFDLDSAQPIVLDAEGDVVKPKTKKAGLACFICKTRLRLSSSYRSEDDRVWTLRCGHLIDQRCLNKLSVPTTAKELDSVQPPLHILPVLGSAEKSRKRKKARTVKEPPREYVWECPAKGCGQAHTSVRMPQAEEWVQEAGSGAFQVYM